MCKYCEGCSDKEHGKGEIIANKESGGFKVDFFITGNELEANVYVEGDIFVNNFLPCVGININFCPICGVRLRKPIGRKEVD